MSESTVSSSMAPPDPWVELRRFTQARIALGSVGASLPTSAVLELSMAQARARDAVHHALPTEALASTFEAAGFAVLHARSRAVNRMEYLGRPDLGRQLEASSAASLRSDLVSPPNRLTVIVADGLSSLAAMRHALPLLLEVRAMASPPWTLDAVVIATQARVALSDEVGELRHAEAVVMLLGERPGLSSTDSLGIYITYAPRRGRSEAERNCISNVRHEGLSYAEAAYKLLSLLDQSRQAGGSGILIKDRSEARTDLPACTMNE